MGKTFDIFFHCMQRIRCRETPYMVSCDELASDTMLEGRQLQFVSWLEVSSLTLCLCYVQSVFRSVL